MPHLTARRQNHNTTRTPAPVHPQVAGKARVSSWSVCMDPTLRVQGRGEGRREGGGEGRRKWVGGRGRSLLLDTRTPGMAGTGLWGNRGHVSDSGDALCSAHQSASGGPHPISWLAHAGVLGDPRKAVGCVGLGQNTQNKTKQKWEKENTASLQRETDQLWVIHTAESHLLTGIRFINTTPSEEEQASSREVQLGTMRADLKHTTQGLPYGHRRTW